ncbi:MAG TPA: efflux RND transporter periplasmic adaptor subunit [Pirellulales bacterium]
MDLTTPPCRRAFAWLLIMAVAAIGCEKHEQTNAPSLLKPPVVKVVQPEYRKIVAVVGQPSFVESYERTSIYPKVSGYIKQWNVDIGDKVKKGDVLCTLFVPELVEDAETKHRTVKLDEERVRLAEQIVKVADAKVKAAQAALEEAKAIVDKYKSDTWRWDLQVNRLDREVKRSVVDPQIALEARNQHQMSKASWMAAEAAVLKAQADLLAAEETLSEDQVDVDVAKARVRVAESDAKRMDAWVGYLTIPAPYDGVVVARNANSWDFVLPAAGDPTADVHAPHLSPSGKGAPIYVVDRTDIVRVFVDIPEKDANYVRVGSKARVQIKAYRDQWLPAAVTRTAWALNMKSRTLRAEIDLANLGTEVLPGMYAYGKVVIERPNVLALPASAIVHRGDQTYYWSYQDGHAALTEVETAVSDGDWVEVTNRQSKPKYPGEEPRSPIDGSELVIVGDTSVLSEGCEVRLEHESAPHDTELASDMPEKPKKT